MNVLDVGTEITSLKAMLAFGGWEISFLRNHLSGCMSFWFYLKKWGWVKTYHYLSNYGDLLEIWRVYRWLQHLSKWGFVDMWMCQNLSLPYLGEESSSYTSHDFGYHPGKLGFCTSFADLRHPGPANPGSDVWFLARQGLRYCYDIQCISRFHRIQVVERFPM